MCKQNTELLKNKGFAKTRAKFLSDKTKAQVILCVLTNIFVNYDGNFADAFCKDGFDNSSKYSNRPTKAI